jgi:fructose-1,6-bisphosphatase/inositol monophosphatase family enzyme
VLADRLLDVALEAANGAAAILKEGVGQARQDVRTKSSPTDMVSEMDRAAEAFIDQLLTRRRPDDAVLAEEGSDRTGTSGVRWIVDPLDGTTNYLFGIPAYGVSVAVEVDGAATVGVVVDPSRSETWTAVAGRGEQRARQANIVSRVLPNVRDIRRFGSAALDLCWVAAGRVTGYYEWGLQPWDLAAGLLIAAEAGARNATLNDGTVVCAPLHLLGPLCELIDPA